MVTLQQSPLLPLQAPAPYTPAQTSTIDIGSVITQIIPIFVLMMLFGMLTPMMKSMGGAFAGK